MLTIILLLMGALIFYLLKTGNLWWFIKMIGLVFVLPAVIIAVIAAGLFGLSVHKTISNILEI